MNFLPRNKMCFFWRELGAFFEDQDIEILAQAISKLVFAAN